MTLRREIVWTSIEDRRALDASAFLPRGVLLCGWHDSGGEGHAHCGPIWAAGEYRGGGMFTLPGGMEIPASFRLTHWTNPEMPEEGFLLREALRLSGAKLR